MEQQSMIVVKDLIMDQAEGSSAPLSAPLHIRLQYSVMRTVNAPKWSVEYEADIAYKRAVVPLLSSSSLFSLPSSSLSSSAAEVVVAAGLTSSSSFGFTTSSDITTTKNAISFMRHNPIHNATVLVPGEFYELEVYLHTIDVFSVVPETYLLQVSMLRLALFDTAASEKHDGSDSKGNGKEVGSVNIVVQVGKSEEGTLMRLAMNPMK
ncbi:hypothetical protein LSM04_008171 [Trypanosoma melophagium]|uniref:uncharacterized protein n=1 Tax=Trypanosoma melophagium TaxID=715481 RepID=UPI00351A43FF|nr:hypothetical protein LSM04_008171 [Trypanosoma melophagium]